MIFIILLLLIIILFVKIISEYNDIEHYDAKIENIKSSSECGAKCTEELKCAGFGYNSNSNSCFLSKRPILGKPEESVYTDNYNENDNKCNKIRKLTAKTKDPKQLLDNSIYTCDNYGDISSNISSTDLLDKTRQIGRKVGGIIDKKIEIINDSYNFIDNALSYVVDDTIIFSDYKQNSKDLTKELNNYYASTNNAYTINSQTDKDQKNIDQENPQENPQENNDQENNDQTTKSLINKEHGFIESDDDFVGLYMLKPECVSNVTLYDCIKHCDKESNCAGTEWNKSLTKKINGIDNVFENVCCPKSNITKAIKRDSDNKGKFYMKTNLDYIKDREQIHLTKADFNNKGKRESISID